jgi:hypothetical protein
MKKTIFLITLAVVLTFIYAYRQSVKNEKTYAYAKHTSVNGLNDINDQTVKGSEEELKSVSKGIAPDERPRILLMLTNDTGTSVWSPALWWKYKHATPGQPGC